MAFLQPGQGRGPFHGSGQEPALNVPPVVLALIGLLIGVHLALALMPQATADSIKLSLAFIPARVSAIDGVSSDSLMALVSFVSHLFLHVDAMSLAMDGLMLLAFGSAAVGRFGALRFLLLFLLSGVAGALLLFATEPHALIAAAGASGGVSGVVVAAMRSLWRGEEWPTTAPPKLASIFSPQILVFVLVWAGLAVAFAGLGGASGQVVWQPAVGGTLAGLALSSLLDLSIRKIDLPRGPEA